MILRRIWSQQEVSLFGAEFSVENSAAQEDQGSHGIGKRVMPAERGESFAKLIFQAEILDKLPERKGIFFRPDSAGELESIDPWSKTVKRKRAQESSLGRRAMGDEPAIVQKVVNPGPKLGQARCAREILCANAVDPLCCPGDRLLREKKAAEVFTDFELMHERDSNLHGHLGAAPADASALEIDGRKGNLGNGHAVRPNAARRSFGCGILDDPEMR